jgi:hypothetical protein
MSIELLRYPTYLWAILLVALIGWLVVMFVMHFFIPKKLVDACFKEPHFSRSELTIFSTFPFNYFRDIMFMRLAGWPQSGRKRGLTDAYTLAPRWFQVISRLLIRFLIVNFSLLIALGAFLLGAFYYFDNFSG